MRRYGWIGLAAAAALAGVTSNRFGKKQEFQASTGHPIVLAAVAAVAILSTFSLVALFIGTDQENERVTRYVTAYGCAGCHTIPGMRNAVGRVGPVLANLRERTYVGTLRNDPTALAAFIVDPPTVDPGTAMPRTGISRPEADTVARYLLSLD
jgi:mono/diheme cytochrome c family protein